MKRRAVVIGVDEYRDPRIHDLEGSRNDATELAALLARTGDFDVEELLGVNATGEAIRTAVSDLLWRTDEADLALLYFSGHAYDDTYGNGFLAPHDMDYERPWVHGIRMQELNDLMLRAVNKDVVLLVLDACKSGIAASGQKGAEPALPLRMRSCISRRPIRKVGAGSSSRRREPTRSRTSFAASINTWVESRTRTERSRFSCSRR